MIPELLIGQLLVMRITQDSYLLSWVSETAAAVLVHATIEMNWVLLFVVHRISFYCNRPGHWLFGTFEYGIPKVKPTTGWYSNNTWNISRRNKLWNTTINDLKARWESRKNCLVTSVLNNFPVSPNKTNVFLPVFIIFTQFFSSISSFPRNPLVVAESRAIWFLKNLTHRCAKRIFLIEDLSYHRRIHRNPRK